MLSSRDTRYLLGIWLRRYLDCSSSFWVFNTVDLLYPKVLRRDVSMKDLEGGVSLVFKFVFWCSHHVETKEVLRQGGRGLTELTGLSEPLSGSHWPVKSVEE